MSTRYKNSLLVIIGLPLVALTGFGQPAMVDTTPSQMVPPPAKLTVGPLPALIATAGSGPLASNETLRVLAKTDPWALARLGHERCDREIHGYTSSTSTFQRNRSAGISST